MQFEPLRRALQSLPIEFRGPPGAIYVADFVPTEGPDTLRGATVMTTTSDNIPGDVTRTLESLEAESDSSALSATLERIWGFDSFRPMQEEAMLSVLEGRDSLLVLPTGGGKSLCYQGPAVLGEGLTLVISPLISLMKDQVDSLGSVGVPSAFFNSSLSTDAMRSVEGRIERRELKLLYLAPERLASLTGPGASSSPLVAGLRAAKVTAIAVDEAHCISQWGHAFRPDYRLLGELRALFPDASMHAYTATATPRVRKDIVEQLQLVEPLELVGSFDRPNLTYRVFPRTDLSARLRSLISRHPNEGGIVYCNSRRQVESLAEKISGWGIRALPYHAGLDALTRERNQDAFVNEDVEVVVATVAFGMGIDRSNVRFVAHAGAPRSIEHYQQETGRAGRDGLAAECVLFYSPADFVQWRRLLESGGEWSEQASRLLWAMQRFAAATRCRHRQLLEYFGESSDQDGCGACDWCLEELELVADSDLMAQKVLSCVLRIEERWGIGRLVDVLRGRDNEKVRSAGHHNLSTFGLLKDLSISEVRGYVEQLVAAEFLRLDGGEYPILKLTPTGADLLRGNTSCRLFRQEPPRPKSKARKAQAGADWEGVDRELFESLRELRLSLSKSRGVPPYVIFHDSVLRDIARLKPTTPEELLNLHGVGEKKAFDVGPRFLARVDEFSR